MSFNELVSTIIIIKCFCPRTESFTDALLLSNEPINDSRENDRRKLERENLWRRNSTLIKRAADSTRQRSNVPSKSNSQPLILILNGRWRWAINILYGFCVCSERSGERSREQFIREIYFSHVDTAASLELTWQTKECSWGDEFIFVPAWRESLAWHQSAAWIVSHMAQSLK